MDRSDGRLLHGLTEEISKRENTVDEDSTADDSNLNPGFPNKNEHPSTATFYHLYKNDETDHTHLHNLVTHCCEQNCRCLKFPKEHQHVVLVFFGCVILT